MSLQDKYIYECRVESIKTVLNERAVVALWSLLIWYQHKFGVCSVGLNGKKAVYR